ncbi:MAG: glycosyltransferase [Dermatophilaceae bacterium]
MPDIAVILPTFNRLHYVDEAIASVLAQENVDLELIIVDDCSTDGTYEYLRDRYNGQRRIRVIRTPENGGPSAAKNAAIAVAAAPLVTLLCDDDALRVGALAAAVELMAVRDDVSFAWFAVAKYDRSFGAAHLISEEFAGVPLIADPAKRELAWARSSPGDGHLLVVRRECYAEVGGYAAELRAAGDTDLLLRLMRRFDYTCVPRVLVNVRLHDSGQTVRNAELRATMFRLLLERQSRHLAISPQAHAIWLTDAATRYHAVNRRWEARSTFMKALRAAPNARRTWITWAALEYRALAGRLEGVARRARVGASHGSSQGSE